MKILLINNFFYKKGGAEDYFFALRTLLKAQKHQVLDFSMQDIKNEPSAESQYFIDNLNFSRGQGIIKSLGRLGHALWSCQAQKRLERLIRAKAPQIAHLHNISYYLTPAIIKTLKRHNIPVIMTLHDHKLICPNAYLFTQGQPCERCKVHKYYNCVRYKCIRNSYSFSLLGMLEMYLHKVLVKTFNQVDLFICPSHYLYKKMLAWGIDKNKLVQLYNFTDLPANLVQTAGSDIVCISRLASEKSPLTVIKAMELLPQYKLTLIGDGPQQAEIKQYLKDHKITNVNLLPYSNSAEFKYLAQAKVVIVPSVVPENNPMVIVKAFSLGRPVIASKAGGIPELVIPGQTGLLFTPGNSLMLSQQIKAIMEDSGLWPVWSQNCLNFSHSNFTSSQHYQSLVKIYQELAK